MDQSKLNLTFVHPKDSAEQYVLEAAPQATPRQCITELIKGDDQGPWLPSETPGRPFELVLSRTQTLLDADTPIGQSGVVDGDVLAVAYPGQGACRR